MLLKVDSLMLFCKTKRRVSLEPDEDSQQESKRRSEIQAFNSDELIEDFASYPKSDEEESLIRSAIEQNEFLLNILPGGRLQTFINCMYRKNVSKGETLIQQGEIGTRLYISIIGTYEVIIDDASIAEFSDVRVFGELAILYSAQRTATVKALEDGTVWVLDGPAFKRVTIKTALEELEEKVTFLMNVPKLNTVSKDKLYKVAHLLKIEFFATSQEIVRQCEIGNKFYIIRAGTVTVIKDDTVVAQLSKGQFFGELALLTDEFRQATVKAGGPGVECLSLNRKDFIDHFGEIDDFIKLKMEPILQSQHSLEYMNVDIEDFNVIRTIGMGAYGRVQLVQHTNQKNLVFVMKFMKKHEVNTKSHQDQVFNERNLQMVCTSPFIIRMYRTFKNAKFLYFLLESCLGGDLWSLLHRQGSKRLDEDTTRFYAACVLEGLSYLHDLGIIYRDLKPENIIVHNNGYLKIADFGFAKKTDAKEKTFTFVGTPEYVAPELIQNLGYNKSVDYWAYGILIYEMLVGRTPFRTKDPAHLSTYKLILRGIESVNFPGHVPKRAKALIKKLCKTFPSERLGNQKSGVKAIKTHMFFADFDWDKLRNLEMDAPFKPEILHNTDTKYFEHYSEDLSEPPDDFADWDRDF